MKRELRNYKSSQNNVKCMRQSRRKNTISATHGSGKIEGKKCIYRKNCPGFGTLGHAGVTRHIISYTTQEIEN